MWDSLELQPPTWKGPQLPILQWNCKIIVGHVQTASIYLWFVFSMKSDTYIWNISQWLCFNVGQQKAIWRVVSLQFIIVRDLHSIAVLLPTYVFFFPGFATDVHTQVGSTHISCTHIHSDLWCCCKQCLQSSSIYIYSRNVAPIAS